MHEPLRVESLFRTYEVRFVADPGDLLKEISSSGAFTIADPEVIGHLETLCGGPVPRERLLELPASEDAKTLDGVQDVIRWLVESKARRGGTLVALGGGVVQDVTAFTASVLYRGLDWVFIPTTLLAQADSCIGSKTSINAGGYKNVIGNFYPPARILIEKGFLESLPEDEIRSGIGEIMHFYIYEGSPLLARMLGEYEQLLADRSRLQPYIAESLRIKKRVVESDEFDRGERNKFNYGHTFGHALEAVTRFGIRHGQAVTVGMDLANYLSVRLGLLEEEVDAELHGLLRINFPDWEWSDIEIEDYLRLLSKDKKNTDGDLTCILCRGPGRLERVKIPLDDSLQSAIEAYFSGDWDRQSTE